MAFEQRSLDDYIDVPQRIADFREKYPEGTLAPWNPAEPWRLVQAEGFNKDGSVEQQTFIIYVAAAYRHPGDPNPGVGMAWEIFPGRTPYTRGSELQNAETSAWGRAIVAVGASDSKRGISSREEVRNRQAEREPEHNHPTEGMDLLVNGCPACMAGMPRNRDGSLSRSRTSDAEKAAAGVMTDAEQRAHNQLERDTLGTDSKGKLLASGRPDRVLVSERPDWDGRPAVDAAVDGRWTSDAPSWLVGVDPPEDQPGSILPAQRKQAMAVYGALKIATHEDRVEDMNRVLGTSVKSSTELSYQQAARLLENLHERHTGKTTRR